MKRVPFVSSFQSCVISLNNVYLTLELIKILIRFCCEKILQHFPETQAQSDGNMILIFQQGLQQVLKQAFNSNYGSDAILLSKAAKIIWQDIFNLHGFCFNGSFPPGCQQVSHNKSEIFCVNVVLCIKLERSRFDRL